jgi:hypothetical protein
LSFFFLVSSAETSFAAKKEKAAKGGAIALTAEALSAKALLEDLLSRRYSQELATSVDQKSFSISANLDLIQVPPVETKVETPAEPEPISDLMLGTLDPEELLKKYSSPNEGHVAQGLLENFRIRAVAMSVGLKDDLKPEVKAQVEIWLTKRLKDEFGKNGKGTVSFIQFPQEKQAPEKTLWDWLSQFQNLAGQLSLAVALLLGVILWQILAPRKSAEPSPMSAQAPQPAASNTPSQDTREPSGDPKAKVENEDLQIAEDLRTVSSRLNELVPRLLPEFENIIRSWCQMGDEGRMKVACFAEAVGKELGKLPIPVDALPDISKVFRKMTEVGLKEKRDILQKAYWDLLTAVNLGSEALSQPFGYLGGLNINLVNQVLIDQNPKMKTLVSLYMPVETRTRYVQSLPVAAKKELLESAVSLSSVPRAELRSLDSTLAKKLKPDSNRDVIPLEMTLNKIVEALTPIEEATLLQGLQGSAIDDFKRVSPSLAFLGEWPEDKLSILLSRVSADELLPLLRIRQDLQEKFIRICPPMTAEMLQEELVREDKSSERDKNTWLQALSGRMKEMVALREVVLEDLFHVTATPLSSKESSPAAGTSNPGGSQKAS